VRSKYIFPIKRLIHCKNTLNLNTVVDLSKSVQASLVQVQQKWGLVRSWSNKTSDLIGLDMDGSGLDCSNVVLLEWLIVTVNVMGGIASMLRAAHTIKTWATLLQRNGIGKRLRSRGAEVANVTAQLASHIKKCSKEWCRMKREGSGVAERRRLWKTRKWC